MNTLPGLALVTDGDRAALLRRERELTVRIASLQAEASVERERHAAERARLQLELERARAARTRLWPVWLAIGLCAALAAASLWLALGAR